MNFNRRIGGEKADHVGQTIRRNPIIVVGTGHVRAVARRIDQARNTALTFTPLRRTSWEAASVNRMTTDLAAV